MKSTDIHQWLEHYLVWTGKEITASEITCIILQDIVLSEMSLVLSDRC